MGLWNLNTPPNWHPTAIATPAGWQDPITGELLVAIVGLSTIKEPNGAPALVRVTFDKLLYKHGDTAHVIAQYSEPVTVTGTPQVTISVNGTPHTLSYTSGTGTAFVVFSYTVGGSDVATPGELTISTPLALNSGTIKGTSNTTLTVGSVTGTYVAGETVTGGTSLATGIVRQWDSGNGFIYLTNVVGTFQTSEVVTGGTSGATSTTSAVGFPNAPLSFSADPSVALTQINAVVPTISTVTIPNGSYSTGMTIPVTVTFSAPVQATGSPVATLNFGDSSTTGSATVPVAPISQFGGTDSLSTTLIFNYIVQAADVANQGDLTISSPLLTPNGATIKDAVGNPATLTHSATFPLVGVNDEGMVLSVALQANTNGSLDFQTGDVMTWVANFDQTVTVTGSPLLPFNIHSDIGVAVYASGSGSNLLTFTYTVGSGDAAAQSQLTTGTSISLNSGTIDDVNADAVGLTFAQVSVTTATVNTAIITSVTGAPNAGNYVTGAVMTLTAQFNENVTVATAVPYIAVTIGGNTRHFVYTAGSGTAALSFAYTIVGGDAATAGNFTIATSITLNGATINNGAAVAAVLTFTAPVTSGVVVNDPAGIISTPTLAAGNYVTGQLLPVTVVFSKAVTVTGTPTLALTTTSGTYAVPYSSGSGTTSLVFNYEVQANDTVGSVSSAATTLVVTGATIKDAYGVAFTNSFSAAGTFSGVLTNDEAASLGAAALSSTGLGAYPVLAIGDVFVMTFAASKAITVTGTPYISATFNGVTRQVSYASGSGTTALVFNYTTQSGDVSSPGQVTVAQTVTLNGGTMKDSLGGPAILGFTANAGLISVINDSGATISTPTVAAGNYTTGLTIPVVVGFSAVVNVTGTPTIAITTPGGTRSAAYASGSGTSSLTFNYTVVSGDTIGAVSSAATSLGLSGATVKDTSGIAVVNTFSAASTFTGVAVNDVLATLGTPVGSDVTNGPRYASGVTHGDVLALTFTASKAVTVTGTPYATVTTAGGVRHFTYASGTGSTTLVFNYTTVSGDIGIATTISNTSPIVLNGGTMKDSLGIPVTLTYTPANMAAVSIS